MKYSIQFCTLRVTKGDLNPHLCTPQHELTSCLPHKWAEDVKATRNMVWFILSPVVILNTIYTAMYWARIPATCPVWKQTIDLKKNHPCSFPLILGELWFFFLAGIIFTQIIKKIHPFHWLYAIVCEKENTLKSSKTLKFK